MRDKALVFLHLSDIHFNKNPHGDVYDLDHDLRRALLNDAIEMGKCVGPPHGILVTGDIAFSASEEQYRQATTWLQDLTEGTGCALSQIWCVPGNHDIDRQVIEQRRTVRDARTNLRTCDVSAIDFEIEDYLSDPDVFYAPLENYNRFAAQFECHVTKEQPIWDTRFRLNDGSCLWAHGLNSTLISDQNDKVEDGQKLVLGRYQYQTQLPVDDLNLVLCHHPPDWLRETDDIEAAFAARACIQMFGHRHRQRLETVGGGLRVSAGAVHPNRREPNWEPRYNWILARVCDNDGERALSVEVLPRLWTRDGQRFSADRDLCGREEMCTFLLSVGRQRTAGLADMPVRVGHVPRESEEDTSRPVAGIAGDRENPIMERSRILTQRYFSLSYVQKMKVADELGLHENKDRNLGGVQLLLRHLERAKERNLLAQLWEAVERRHGDGRYPCNPYAGSAGKGE